MNRNLIRQAQELQQRLAKAQEALEHETVEGTSGGGAVKVVVSGKMKAQSVKIAAEAVDPQDVAILEDLVLAAVNDAMDKAQELAAKRMSAVTGGMKIPGLM